MSQIDRKMSVEDAERIAQTAFCNFRANRVSDEDRESMIALVQQRVNQVLDDPSDARKARNLLAASKQNSEIVLGRLDFTWLMHNADMVSLFFTYYLEMVGEPPNDRKRRLKRENKRKQRLEVESLQVSVDDEESTEKEDRLPAKKKRRQTKALTLPDGKTPLNNSSTLFHDRNGFPWTYGDITEALEGRKKAHDDDKVQFEQFKRNAKSEAKATAAKNAAIIEQLQAELKESKRLCDESRRLALRLQEELRVYQQAQQDDATVDEISDHGYGGDSSDESEDDDSVGDGSHEFSAPAW